MFGLSTGPGRLELERLCAQLVDAAQRRKTSAVADTVRAVTALLQQRRRDNLNAFGTGLAVVEIEKVYAALSWLLRDDGGVGMNDGSRAAVFQCLTVLAEDWHPAWIVDGEPAYQRWHTVLGLGLYLLLRGANLPQPKPAPSATAGETSKIATRPVEMGEPTRVAILEFIAAMLRPRRRSGRFDEGRAAAWEWDGVSELPSLQDALDFFEYDPDFKREQTTQDTQGPQTAFPITAHLRWANQNTEAHRRLMQICVISLDIACKAEYSDLLRATALQTARIVFTTWLAGVNEATVVALKDLSRDAAQDGKEDKSATALASKVRCILPGMVSALIRILTGKSIGANLENVNTRPLPSKSNLAVIALEMLTETTILGYDDRATKPARTVGPATGGLKAPSVSLEELAARASGLSTTDDEDSSSYASPSVDQQPGTQSLLESTLKMITALRLVVKAFQQPQTVHHAILHAAVDLVTTLLARCSQTFSWAEGLPQAQAVPRSSLGDELVQLLIDITGVAQRTSKPLSSKSWTALLNLSGSNELSETTRRGRPLSEDTRRFVLAIDRVASSALQDLALAIRTDREDEVIRDARRICVAAALFDKVAVKMSHRDEGFDQTSDGSQAFKELSLLLLILRPESIGDQNSASHHAFFSWSSTLLQELGLADSEDSAPWDSATGSPDLRLKIGKEAQEALQLALRSVSAAIVKTWVWRQNVAAKEGKLSGMSKRHDQPQTVEAGFAFVLHFLQQGARLRTTRLTLEAMMARRLCSSTLFVADQLFSSAASQLLHPATASLAGSKAQRRAARKLGKLVVQIVKSVLEEDGEEAMDPTNAQALLSERASDRQRLSYPSSAKDEVTIEFRQGVEARPLNMVLAKDGVEPLQDGDTVASAVSRQERAIRQVNIATVLLLNLLATAAELIGQEFETTLISLIYPLVCSTTSSANMVRQAGKQALERIAYACGYPDLRGALRACADWVVSSTSQRIINDLAPELALYTELQSGAEGRMSTVPGTLGGCALPLSSAQGAPYVLVEFVRLLGVDALVSVEDAVDEILDALDRFHGYQDICQGLLGVLRALLSASADLTASGPAIPSLKNKGAPFRVQWQPEADQDLDSYEHWFHKRMRPETLDQVQDGATGLADVDGDNGEGTPARKTGDSADALNPPPSRSQQIVANILKNSIPYLSHPSAVIRAQVLRLLSYGVLVLGSQGRELELIPLLNRAWPILLARLGASATTPDAAAKAQHSEETIRPMDGRRPTMLGQSSEQEPAVWLEAVNLIAVLAEHCSASFGQRIIDDAWPRLRLLLMKMARLEAQSVNVHRTITPGRHDAGKAVASAETSTKPLYVPDELSQGGRLLTAILNALQVTVRQVGIHLDEVQAWLMATDAMILGSMHDRQATVIRKAADGVVASFAARNPDAAWLALRQHVRTDGQPDNLSRPLLKLAYLQSMRPELELGQARFSGVVSCSAC